MRFFDIRSSPIGHACKCLVLQKKKGSVINIEGAGVIFAGDFPHYGVRNVASDETVLNSKMTHFFSEIGKTITDDAYSVVENTPGLNELCRLFLKVKPIKNEFEIYNLHAVGTFPSEFSDYPLGN